MYKKVIHLVHMYHVLRCTNRNYVIKNSTISSIEEHVSAMNAPENNVVTRISAMNALQNMMVASAELPPLTFSSNFGF